jgi:hypothetical protein
MDTDQTPKQNRPEEYIRTFASDMDIYQKGGTPGLAPLKPLGSAPIQKPAEEAVPVPEPLKPIIPIPEALSAPSAPVGAAHLQARIPIEPQQAPAERLVTGSPLDFEPIKMPQPTFMPPVPKPTVPSRAEAPAPIETYSQDFKDRVRATNASQASIIAAEQDAQTAAPEVSEEAHVQSVLSTRNMLYVIAALLMLGIGGAAIYIGYSSYTASNAPVIIPPSVSLPIFVDAQEVVSGSGTALMQEISQSLGKPLSLNSVRLLSFDPASTSAKSVFSSLGTSAPGILVRNIDPMNSMAGIVNAGSGQSPFFILSVSGYSSTFSGMLAWEPNMQKDLAKIFPLYALAPVATTTVATTTKSGVSAPKMAVATTSALDQKEGFRDEVVGNHDVRVYRDSLSRSILLYGYWNQGTLVITRDPTAFLEIIGRLGTSHTK